MRLCKGITKLAKMIQSSRLKVKAMEIYGFMSDALIDLTAILTIPPFQEGEVSEASINEKQTKQKMQKKT